MKDQYQHVPQGLIYTDSNIPGKGCDQHLFTIEPLPGCDCSADDTGSYCCTNECSCQLALGPNYDSHGRIVNTTGPLFECRQSCSCWQQRCSNRVVQQGPIQGLQVRPAPPKGLGVFCPDKPIGKGQFVCEFAGEVIGTEEAASRQAADEEKGCAHFYMFWLNERFLSRPHSRTSTTTTTIIDPTVVGNIGRYLNHSCQPNLAPVVVRSECMVPHLAFFAVRDVTPGEELTYSYGQSEGSGGRPCLCGSALCSKSLPIQALAGPT